MSGWNGSNRSAELPDDWKDLVKQVWKRAGGICEAKLPVTGKRCPRAGADVDHKYGRDNHALWALQLLCRHHHDQKTHGEAQRGRRRKRPPRRPEERHPGLRRA